MLRIHFQRLSCALLASVICVVSPALAQEEGSDGDGITGEIRQLIQNQQWAKAITTLRDFLHENPDVGQGWYYLALSLHMEQDYEDAIEANLKAATFDDVKSNSLYNLACEYALLKRTDEAFDALRLSIDAGFNDFDNLQSDSDLASLHDDARWAGLPKGFPFSTLSTNDGTTIEYALVLPEDFDDHKTYPMLIAFPPGIQSRGAATTGLNYWWGQPAAHRGWIVAVMVRPQVGWMSDTGGGYMAQVLDAFDERYNLEGGKFHAAGCSGAGPASFHVALDFPDRFHSLTGLPADPRGGDFNRLDRLADVRVNLLVGGDDDGWKQSLQRAQNEMKSLGVASTLEVFPGEGHVIQAILGDEFMRRMDELRVRN